MITLKLDPEARTILEVRKSLVDVVRGAEGRRRVFVELEVDDDSPLLGIAREQGQYHLAETTAARGAREPNKILVRKTLVDLFRAEGEPTPDGLYTWFVPTWDVLEVMENPVRLDALCECR